MHIKKHVNQTKSQTSILVAAIVLFFALLVRCLAVTASQDPDSRPRRSTQPQVANPTPSPTSTKGTTPVTKTANPQIQTRPTPSPTPAPKPTPTGQVTLTLGEPPPSPRRWRAQPIEFFTKEEVPITYVLVVDTSGSLRSQLKSVIDAAKAIINSNKRGDETFLESFISSDKIETIQDFTADKGLLLDGLDSLYVEGGQTAVIDGVYLAVNT